MRPARRSSHVLLPALVVALAAGTGARGAVAAETDEAGGEARVAEAAEAVEAVEAVEAAEGGEAGEIAQDAPLSFAFLDDVPGELHEVAGMRLHLDCDAPSAEGGEPDPVAPVVLFEAGLGGSALEWGAVRERLRSDARTCAYDRAGYGWSDPTVRVRTAGRLAAELAELLAVAHLGGAPVIVVAHSFGGFVARLLATRRPDLVAGLVLVDSSHEEQFTRLEAVSGKLMLPRGRQFVISQSEVPEGLPPTVRRRVAALGRMRKTYAATHGELASFRASAVEVQRARAARNAPLDVPVTVIRRGGRLYPDDERGRPKNDGWIELQQDLAALGTPGRLVVAEGAGHHVHIDAPGLVAREVRALVAGARVAAAAKAR